MRTREILAQWTWPRRGRGAHCPWTRLQRGRWGRRFRKSGCARSARGRRQQQGQQLGGEARGTAERSARYVPAGKRFLRPKRLRGWPALGDVAAAKTTGKEERVTATPDEAVGLFAEDMPARMRPRWVPGGEGGARRVCCRGRSPRDN